MSETICQDDSGRWWFPDEACSYRSGPYASREEAERLLAAYCRRLDAGEVSEDLNLTRWED